MATLVNTVFHEARRSFGSPRIEYAAFPVHMHRVRVDGWRSMRRSSWSPPLLMLPALPRLLEGPHGEAGRLCGGCHCCRRHGCGCWAPVVLARPTASALRKAGNTLLQRGGVLERVLHAVKRQQPAVLLVKRCRGAPPQSQANGRLQPPQPCNSLRSCGGELRATQLVTPVAAG